VNGKPILFNFDGAEMSSNAGLTLLREVERQHGLAGLVASCLTDERDPNKTRHSLDDIARFRILMIAASGGGRRPKSPSRLLHSRIGLSRVRRRAVSI